MLRLARVQTAPLLSMLLLSPFLSGCPPSNVASDVVGLTHEEATGAIERAGYPVGTVSLEHSDAASDWGFGAPLNRRPEPIRKQMAPN